MPSRWKIHRTSVLLTISFMSKISHGLYGHLPRRKPTTGPMLRTMIELSCYAQEPNCETIYLDAGGLCD
jgi:hypothetical protein